jgi:hypothetical protein
MDSLAQYTRLAIHNLREQIDFKYYRLRVVAAYFYAKYFNIKDRPLTTYV